MRGMTQKKLQKAIHSPSAEDSHYRLKNMDFFSFTHEDSNKFKTDPVNQKINFMYKIEFHTLCLNLLFDL